MHADNPLRITCTTGEAIGPVSQAFRALQMDVFGEWPYLLQPGKGTRQYMSRYARNPRAAVFLAWDGATVVGGASCLPLADEGDHIRGPFEARGWDPADFFYYAEGLIRAPYRGRGLGVRLFELRRSHARAVSTAEYAVFCSVRRPAVHPLRPAVPPDNSAFWRRRGFVPLEGVSCTMTWRDRGEAAESPHILDFWITSLNGKALPA